MGLLRSFKLLWSGRGSRRAARAEAVGIACELGDVLDYSATGMRVMTEDKPAAQLGDVMELAVTGPGWSRQLSVRVARINRASLRLWEIGFEFLGEPGPAAPRSDSAPRGVEGTGSVD